MNQTLGFNYRSFIAYFIDNDSILKDKVVQEFRKIVINVGEESSSYNVNLISMSSLKVKVEPQRLVFKHKYEKLSYKLILKDLRCRKIM